MRRKVFAVIATLAMVLGLASVATAATLIGTATLTAGQDVVPGTGQNAREFSVRVANNHPSDTLLSRGPRFNYVSIILPTDAGITTNASTITPPAGWKAQVIDNDNVKLHEVRFRPDGGEGLAPGANVTFTFPADVAAPASGDRSGDFVVSVSDDGGKTLTGIGNLTSTVRVLEVVDLGALAPAGVTDQSATSGQSITYGVAVRNHATQALAVTPSLSSDGGDTVVNVAAATINSNGTKTFEFPVATRAVENGTSTSTFTGDATSEAADAIEKRLGLEVQGAPKLALDPSFFNPKFVKSGTLLTYDFSVLANKSNPPTLALSDCTLSFAGTTTTLASPVSFAENAGSADLKFKSTRVEGAEGEHAANVKCQGVDGNGKAASYDVTLDKLITIDNTLPGVTVDLAFVSRGAGQTAVSNEDTLNIVVNVDESVAADKINLRTNGGDGGQEIPCDVSSTRSTRHTCTVKNPDFESSTTKVLAEAQVTDKAGNIGAAASSPLDVDLGVPELISARTESLKQVRVEFDDQTVLRGGCNPQQWRVQGHVVSKVLFSDGTTDCTSPPKPRGQGGPGTDPQRWSKARILVLADSLNDRDETPKVTYTQDTSANPLADNVFDAALHQAVTDSLDSVVGIVPPAPQLTVVTRSDHETGAREDAYREQGAGTKNKPTGDKSDKYWTNQTGSNLHVGFTGGKANYLVQAVDGNGNVLVEQTVDASGGGTIAVPIGNADGTFVRGIRLKNAAGAGDALFFDVGLDRVRPDISGSTIDGDGDEVTVSFSEVIPSTLGTDYANDWFVWQRADGGRTYYHPNEVTVGSTDVERKLTVQLPEPELFGGVVYLFTSGEQLEDAKRYEDRAGNFLPDSDT